MTRISSIALVASRSHLAALQEATEALGWVTAWAGDPSFDRPNAGVEAEVVLVLLDGGVGETFEPVEKLLLRDGGQTLFDEGEGRETWDSGRWRHHLQSKLERLQTGLSPHPLPVSDSFGLDLEEVLPIGGMLFAAAEAEESSSLNSVSAFPTARDPALAAPWVFELVDAPLDSPSSGESEPMIQADTLGLRLIERDGSTPTPPMVSLLLEESSAPAKVESGPTPTDERLAGGLAPQIGLVALVGGIGGPAALKALLGGLDPRLDVPVAVFQALPHGHATTLAQNLGKASRLPVAVAGVGEALSPGHVWLMPEGTTACMGANGWQADEGLMEDTLMADAPMAIGVVSGADPNALMGLMNASAMGALLVGQNPEEAVEPGPLLALAGMGVACVSAADMGVHLSEHWGLTG